MQKLPVPCPSHLIPDATDRFDAAYRAAKAQGAVFVGIEREGERWTVKTDALTAGSGHVVDEAVNAALRAAVVRLVREREAGTDAFAGPVYFMLHGVPSETRARELAAAFQAALYGDLGPLRRAVPSADFDQAGDAAG
ncbi:hypothetical protein M2163_000829 [Streptomyces sp. SAI-135]|uniref:hypothetical protein n=1 Tax=unclassified Streptomyces TaxID=2593676 RepID=UPI002473ED43|nr:MULTISPECIES: hypothetical protein [unclassified Streptomyces]MDH6522663.1 hypothetical protein [Streptomyces sp. SAI-090]MDH6554284.1 hypothetical protein [Streptomyces sp. SAI-041]MDH6573546.1 hypothetical protein [Streptomyces sp. SAI-117]MDH6581717.1 hypothetical protein [Streptomyces sp. SAI-133]MDH6613721.1 hypothetical protein [Streptomyces sp. SAI-135]